MDEYESSDEGNQIESIQMAGNLIDSIASTSQANPADQSNENTNSFWGADAGLSIADMVAQVATEVLTEQLLPGYIYYPDYGMYYNHESGYFYDQNTSLFYHPSTQCYYFFNEKTKAYEVHSKVAHPKESDKRWKKKKYLKRAKKLLGDEKVDDIENEGVDILEVLFDLVDRCSFLFNRPSKKKKDKNKKTYVKTNGKYGDIIFESDGPEVLYVNSESENEVEIIDELKLQRAAETESSKHPPCIRAIELSNANKLHIVTISGATIGSYPHNDIWLKYCKGLDKYHMKISYEESEYKIWCLSQKIPVWINAEQLQGYHKILHGDMLTLGSHRLLFHIHSGNNTCNGCEPGLLPQAPEEPKEEPKIVKRISTEHKRRKNVLALKEAFGLLDESDEDEQKTPYIDRAKKRRKEQGFEIPGQKQIVPGHSGIYLGCQAAPISGASADTVVLKTAPKASAAVPISSQNKGFQLLKSMGWKEGEGLGKEGKGMVGPIISTVKADRAGLGSATNVAKLPPKSAKQIEKEEILKITKERFENASFTK